MERSVELIEDYNSHTYIIGHYIHLGYQDYNIASHTTVRVNSIHESRDLQFNGNSERQILEKLFHGRNYLLSKFLPEIC